MFASGASALICEVVWSKLLALHAGADPATLGAVLIGFLGGLGAGGWLAARPAQATARPLLLMALLEAGAACFAAFSTYLFPAAIRLFDQMAGPLAPDQTEGPAVKLVAAALVAVPAALMGGSLPVAARALARDPGQSGRHIARLYAWNTLGGACGAAAAGFVLLPRIGLPGTLWAAAAVQGAVAVSAVVLTLRRPRDSFLPPPALLPGRPQFRTAPDLICALALGGAAALAAEVGWAHLFHAAFGSSTYALAAVLTAYLLGLGAGGHLPARLLDRHPAPACLFGALHLGAAVSVLCLVGLLARLPGWTALLSARWSAAPTVLYAAEGILAAALLLPVTLVLGAAFPVSCRSILQDDRLPAAVGFASAVNLTGGMAGILAGRAAVDSFGLRRTLLMASALHAAAGLCALARRYRQLPVRTGVLLAAGAAVATLPALAPWDKDRLASGAYLHGPLRVAGAALGAGASAPGQLRFYRETSAGLVSVREAIDGTLSLAVNGRTEASSGADRAAQLWAGHLPALLVPEAQTALVVGLASGITLGALIQHPLERVECVELVGAMAEASEEFGDLAGFPLRDPRVRLHVGDARRFLARHAGPYDLIVSQPSNPWVAGVSALFSREFFELARARLSPRGRVAVWLQAYAIDPLDFQAVLATFLDVFPSASLWEEAPAGGDYFLIGAAGGEAQDWSRVAAALQRPGAQEHLAPLGVRSLGELLAHRVAGPRQLAVLAGPAPLVTDANLRLEFTTPLHLSRRSVPEIAGLLARTRPQLSDVDLSGLSDAQRRQTLRQLADSDRQRARDLEILQVLHGQADILASDPRLQHAAALMAAGWMDASAAELESLLAGEPDSALSWLLLGAARLSRGSPDLLEAAREALQRAATLGPDDATAWNLLGRTQLQLRDPLAARLSFDRALALRPDFAEALNNRGALQLELGRPAEALTDLERAIALDPTSAPLRANLGLALRRLGRAAESRRAYEQGLALDPDHPDLHFNLAALDLAERRFEQALEHYRRAAALAGDDAFTERGQGEALLGLGRAPEAREHFERSLALLPAQPDLLHLVDPKAPSRRRQGT